MPEFAIRRVVLGLDAVSELREAVDTAAALAKSWRAELHGLFIRDAGLLRLAEFPFVREVTFAAEPRPMAPEELLAQLAASADRAQKLLGEAAAQRKLAWSFRAVTGTIAAPSLSPIGPSDFVVVHGRALPVTPYFRTPSPWIGAVAALDAPRLIVREGDTKGVLLALFSDATDPAEQAALRLAAGVAESTGMKLSIVQVAPGEPVEKLSSVTVGDEQLPVEAVVRTGPPLLRYIEAAPCRMLAFSGRSSVGKLLFASPSVVGGKSLLVV